MKKPKKFAVGGYTQKPTGPAKPMGPIMGPKSTDGSGVMSGLRSMASSLKPNMVTEKPNMGPNASTNQTQGSPLKGFSAGFDPTKPSFIGQTLSIARQHFSCQRTYGYTCRS